jgi:asparagine synthase (glutamine-hydrolysing)
LAGVLPYTWPGWNYLYAMGKVTAEGIPYRLGLYPYIQTQLYTPDLTRQLRDHDPCQLAEQWLRQAAHLDPVSRYQYLDTLQYLPADILTKVDRMSMANSLEVRSPLLDPTVVEYMATLPVTLKLRGHVSKYILRKLGGRLLPSSVLTKRKQGFAIPAEHWFQKELRTFAEDVLLDPRTLARGYFRPQTVRRLLQQHAAGQRDYSTWIWCLMVLEMWFRLFLDDHPRSPEWGYGERPLMPHAEHFRV